MRKAILLLIIPLTLSACDSLDRVDRKKKSYQKTTEEIGEIERKTPKEFLTVVVNDKKNMVGQTVVKGSITNIAKVATFKDVDIRLTFYSKTKSVLEQDVETIYETVGPGNSAPFKSKFFAPKGSDSVGAEVLTAKVP